MEKKTEGGRWNPTREQISVLESMYREGLRTPSAKQIEQITIKLKDFGKIEGKNVFYWFQNHKARIRQKQKQKQKQLCMEACRRDHVQQRPPCAPENGLCNPAYLPTSDIVIHPLCHKMLPHGNGHKKLRISSTENKRAFAKKEYEESHETNRMRSNKNENNDRQTLLLFPLQPTGILRGKQPTLSSLESSSMCPSSLDHVAIFEECSGKSFSEFFSKQNLCL